MTHGVAAANNTAVGYNALQALDAGTGNVAVGYQAGANLSGTISPGTTTSNHIEIGNEGNFDDIGAIRIGTSGAQTTAFIAGV